jgi:hypothetical protein
MRSTMDPRLFRQEITGEFVLAGGRAFPDFDDTPQGNVRADYAEYDPALPLCWALDFNVDPLCSGFIQHDRNGVIRVIDELALPDTVTNAACIALLDRVKERGWDLKNLTIYGDASGSQRRTSAATSGETDWTIVRNALRNFGPRFKVPASNPSIADTRNEVNAKICNAAGERTLFIHPRCKVLIANLRSLLWPSDLAEGHAAAWLRYFVDWEYPVRSNVTLSSDAFLVR